MAESWGDIAKGVLKEMTPEIISGVESVAPSLWDAAKQFGLGNFLGMLPDIIKLASTIVADAHDRAQQDIGATEAAAAAMTAAHAAVEDAIAARQAAEAKAAADPTDTAFDTGFRRTDQ